MRVVPVPCLSDNYAYLVICEQTQRAAIVDPGEAAPILAAVEREGVELVAVWATHHHADHVGGVPAVAEARPGIEVIGHVRDRERIAGLTRAVEDGERVGVGEVTAKIIHNPGHTLGAISYWCEPGAATGAGAVFTGDTLFAAGCGRLFEGTPAQMRESLARLTSLPEATAIYFGHEYTANNLRFAAAVEPDSPAVAARATEVEAVRKAGKPTTPSTVALEKATNPFVRVAEEPVKAAARRVDAEVKDGDPVDVLAVIRRWKDQFR